MEPQFTNPSTTPSMDMRAPQAQAPKSHSGKTILILSIVIIILGTILILLRIKARNDYYKTPEGELQRMTDSSRPVTTTPAEQTAALDALQKSSISTTGMSQEDRLQALQKLGQ